MEFTITLEDVVIPEMCPVLGIPLVNNKETGKRSSPNSASIDRWDNSKGYVPGNVRVISHRANSIKRDAALAEIEAVAAYMRGER